MVDGHSHLTLPGGSHWIDRGSDPTDRLLAVAEANGELQHRSGVRWARDVGAPPARSAGVERALSLGIRDRWQGPAGTGPTCARPGPGSPCAGLLPPGLSVEARDGDELLAAALAQLDDGADFVKLYLDGPDADTPPFTADEVARVVAGGARARPQGHRARDPAVRLPGLRGRRAWTRSSTASSWTRTSPAEMAARGCALVTTMTVLKSWLTFGTTTALPRFTERTAEIGETLETAMASVRLAHAAGVAIVGGTDFGGGSSRANQLPWEIECLVAGGPGAVAGAGQRHLARRRAAGRAGRRGDPRGRPGRLLPGPRRPAQRPHRHVADLARRLTACP